VGNGLGYADQIVAAPNAARVVLKDPVVGANYYPGIVVYAFCWDGYLKPGVGQLDTRRRVVRRIGRSELELDGPIDPRCTVLKWLDAAPIRGPAENDQVALLEDERDLDGLTVGATVFVTDGPRLANEARGEFRTIAAIDRSGKKIQFDRPLRTSYSAAAALVRVKAVRNVTLRNLTIGAPRAPKAVGSCFKYCTGWRLENVRCNSFFGITGCAQFQYKNCESTEQFDLNTCHDVEIVGGHFRGLYLEEGCFDVAATGCSIGPSQINGVCDLVGCERLRLTRVRITGSSKMPISLSGRECILDSVTVEETKNSMNSCYIQGDSVRTTNLTSDVPVIFRAGLNQVVSNVRAPAVFLGDIADNSPSGGIASNVASPKIVVKSKAWTVDPPVAAPKPPR